MKTKLFLLIFLLSISMSYGQYIICYLNTGVDTVHNENNRAIFKLWKSYVENDPRVIYDNPHWNSVEKEKYNSYDLLRSEGFFNPSLYSVFNKNVVLSITHQDGYYLIKTVCYWLDSKDNERTNIVAITNYVAKKENGQFKLYNYLSYHIANWKCQKVGIIDYYYHPEHIFDEGKANLANDFVVRLKSAFGVEVEHIDYYIAEDCDAIHRLKGFDYVLTMGKEPNLCGFFDSYNNIVYSNSFKGEFYEHELVHLINKYFPTSNSLFLVGLSAYYGENTHMGKPLSYHLKRVNEYLLAHPEVDLNNLTEFNQLDDLTGPNYITGAILCHLLLKKGGIDLLKQAMKDTKEDAQFYAFIEKELGVRQTELNQFTRKKIKEYAEKGMDRVQL